MILLVLVRGGSGEHCPDSVDSRLITVKRSGFIKPDKVVKALYLDTILLSQCSVLVLLHPQDQLQPFSVLEKFTH